MLDHFFLRPFCKADILKFIVFVPQIDIDHGTVCHCKTDRRNAQMQDIRLVSGEIFEQVLEMIRQ